MFDLSAQSPSLWYCPCSSRRNAELAYHELSMVVRSLIQPLLWLVLKSLLKKIKMNRTFADLFANSGDTIGKVTKVTLVMTGTMLTM